VREKGTASSSAGEGAAPLCIHRRVEKSADTARGMARLQAQGTAHLAHKPPDVPERSPPGPHCCVVDTTPVAGCHSRSSSLADRKQSRAVMAPHRRAAAFRLLRPQITPQSRWADVQKTPAGIGKGGGGGPNPNSPGWARHQCGLCAPERGTKPNHQQTFTTTGAELGVRVSLRS